MSSTNKLQNFCKISQSFGSSRHSILSQLVIYQLQSLHPLSWSSPIMSISIGNRGYDHFYTQCDQSKNIWYGKTQSLISNNKIYFSNSAISNLFSFLI